MDARRERESWYRGLALCVLTYGTEITAFLTGAEITRRNAPNYPLTELTELVTRERLLRSQPGEYRDRCILVRASICFSTLFAGYLFRQPSGQDTPCRLKKERRLSVVASIKINLDRRRFLRAAGQTQWKRGLG